MDIRDLEKLYAHSPKVEKLVKELNKKSVKTVFLQGLQASSAPMLFASLSEKRKETMLFIMQDADEAGYFYHDLCQIMGEGANVYFFPSSYKRAVKYGQKDAANEILRTETLTAIAANGQQPDRNSQLYIITYPEAIAELVVSKQQLDERTLPLNTGETIDVNEVTETLREYGFREVDYVYEPGQFALRGSILDVFSYNSEFPFRVDFFGDDIDSIRTFEVDSQLSKERRNRIEIVPELKQMTENRVPLLKFMSGDTILVMKDFLFVREQIDNVYNDGFSSQALAERLEGATEMEQKQIRAEMQKETQLITGQLFSAAALNFRMIELGHRHRSNPDVTIDFGISMQPLFHKNFEIMKQSFGDFASRGYRLYILADSAKQQERLKEILQMDFMPVSKTLHEGFVDNDLKLCLFTDHQIFDRFHKYNLKSDKARGGKVALTLKEIQQFEPGDFVVHVDHGIGKFGGLVRMPITSPQTGETTYQEMIKILYQNGDSIYVSIHSLHKVSKYKSQDGGTPPRLSTLGTGQWEKMKERTKKKLKDIARDLIKLYAARHQQQGFAFSHDSYLQNELEASFLYEDTPDQLKATNDVKADMERQQPMDRLVCGDVGFGKTEVAVRAAFKAACDSKQTAVLVPTTVLAYQHYQTFSNRMKGLPVRVDYLSRARTAKQTTEILHDLAEGKIDILIGTHKIIGKNVKFKDLGLLIIDEEQKFGVSTKEKLRQMKTNVDTLTMSATPIPRTLQFSLLGARDLSVIQTPPPNRYPIQTEIHTFSADVISDAINFEMSRNGQVFFVNNRINDLQRIADMIHKYVPDARVAIGHGQMKPEELEKIVFDFMNYDYDVLLSTTIVENGIDIPNANTIIINAAQNFGLSDLHQMRGRVGRGNRKAFCYLLAPPLASLSVDGRRRLEALENFSDLGSGINIAMQDLDIRGAGNLLGAEQSGFIADLGYETYLKILNEAVVELINENPKATATTRQTQRREVASMDRQHGFVTDCTLDSDMELFFPERYVPSDSERMLLYRELDGLKTDDEVERYRNRLLDRFGKLPQASEELLKVVPLRRMGKELGCERILLKQRQMVMYFVSNADSPFYNSEAFERIITYVARYPKRCNFREVRGKRSMVITKVNTIDEAVRILKDVQGEPQAQQ